MRTLYTALLAGLTLLGSACKVEPPNEAQFALPDKPAGPPHGAEQGAGAPTRAPPGTGPLNLDSISPIRSQAEVRAGEHTLISGRVEAGTCTGPVRIDVIARKRRAKAGPPSGEKKAPRGPITALSLPAPGAFDGAVPTGNTYMLSALCDQNADGNIEIPQEPISPPLEIVAKGPPVADIVLDLSGHLGRDVGRGEPAGGSGPAR